MRPKFSALKSKFAFVDYCSLEETAGSKTLAVHGLKTLFIIIQHCLAPSPGILTIT